MSKKLFKIELNLDDETEAKAFVEKYGNARNATLAFRLGFKGRRAFKCANALTNYAWNKVTAIDCRLKGKIQIAIQYETICDRIYKTDIQPFIECW